MSRANGKSGGSRMAPSKGQQTHLKEHLQLQSPRPAFLAARHCSYIAESYDV